MKCTNKYIPTPRFDLMLRRLGGRISLQFDLLFKNVYPDANNDDYEILKEFYDTHVSVDRDRGQKKKRIMNPEDFVWRDLSRPPNETTPRRGISCKSDDGLNVTFTKKFLDVFEKHKKRAIKIVEKNNKDRIGLGEFAFLYPEFLQHLLVLLSHPMLPHHLSSHLQQTYGPYN